ncbi:unnamed protein product [Heterobilharzia americana]|nr:unnamed protein product [Heterobilharzia americana]
MIFLPRFYTTIIAAVYPAFVALIFLAHLSSNNIKFTTITVDISNQLRISELQIGKLTAERDELSKKLVSAPDGSVKEHAALCESRLECLQSELQQAYRIKKDIEEKLNALEYNISFLQIQEAQKLGAKAHEHLKPVTVKVNAATHKREKESQKLFGIAPRRKEKCALLKVCGNSSIRKPAFHLPLYRKNITLPSPQDSSSELRMRSAAKLKASIDDSKIIMAIVQAKQKANKKSMLLEEKALSLQAQQNQKDEKLELALHRRLAKIEAHQAAFKESQNTKYKEIIAKLLREDLLQSEKMKRLPFLCEQSERYKLSKHIYCNEQPSELEQNMIDELLTGQRKTEKMNAVVKKFPIGDELDDADDDDHDHNDDKDRENEKHLVTSHDSLSGLWNLSKKSQNIVTEENVDQAVSNFAIRDTLKSAVDKKEAISVSRPLQKLPSRSSTKLTDVVTAVDSDEMGLLNSTIYCSERSSKADKEILQRILQQTRENIVQPQIVTGRKFDGPSFTAKPAEIWFENIEVDKTHKMKITLTNASYAVSTCRYIGITSTLMDFVEVKFNPPGMLSPGMNFGLKIKFTPKMNKTLTGQLEFLSPTGPFFIPFKATVKKCEFSTDCNVVDFGEVIIGETVFRSIVLRNTGAKGANFTFKALSETYEREDGKIVLITSPGTVIAEGEKEEKLEAKEDNKTQMTDQENAIESNLSKVEEYEGETSNENDGNRCELNKFACNFRCGELKCGFLAPFSTVKLNIIWSPKDVSINEGDCLMEEEKFIITFDDSESSDIYIQAIGYAKNIPVWLSTSSLSMGICWYDRLYQECFSIHNRTKSAVKVVFEVDKKISDHLKVLPKTGFVQAESRLLAQVKLLAKPSLADDLFLIDNDYKPLNTNNENYKDDNKVSLSKLSYDPQTGVLQVPVTVHVIGQTNKLELMIDAVITTTDLSLSPNPINFGWAEIHETVTSRLSITNHSLLPQNFGIVEIPEFLDVQPNNGFGVILGKETIELEVLFKPKKAKEYNFNLVCKSGIGRIFMTTCQGIGVYSPLSLSINQLKFNPTPINESSLATLKIINHHTSSNPYAHVQPCIGSDRKPVPVGPKAFELQVVKATTTNPYGLTTDNDLVNDMLESVLSTFIDFYPATGTLKPGENQQINIRFSPCLSKQCIQQEASRLCDLIKEKRTTGKLDKLNQPLPKAGRNTPIKKEKMTDKRNLKPSDEKPSLEAETSFLPTDPESISEGSEEYIEGLKSLLTYYPNHPPTFTINQDKPQTNSSNNQTSTTETKPSLIRLAECDWPGVFLAYRVACFVADGPGSYTAAKASPSYRKENTLFFELICPIIRPPLLIESTKSYNRLDFGAICAGQRNTRILSIKNISPFHLKLKSKPLNPVGAFEVIQLIESIKSGEVCNLNFAFAPNSSQNYCTETFILQSYPMKNKLVTLASNEYYPLSVKFSGICVTPRIEVTGPPELTTIPYDSQKPEHCTTVINSRQTLHYLNFGYVLLGEFTERLITLTNITNIPLEFQILIDENQIGGSKNRNGLPVFMIIPNQGKIKPGDKQTVSITFAPDHDGETYHQTFRILLHSQYMCFRITFGFTPLLFTAK